MLALQCLGEKRINNIDELNELMRAWNVKRNEIQKGTDWQFTTSEARIKLKRLYPVIIT